ncbi:hypothetical protein K8R33_02335 [archaeon]|nr:hypothetical protein [archaeon]
MKKIIFGVLVLMVFIVSGCEVAEIDPQKAGAKIKQELGGGGGSVGDTTSPTLNSIWIELDNGYEVTVSAYDASGISSIGASFEGPGSSSNTGGGHSCQGDTECSISFSKEEGEGMYSFSASAKDIYDNEGYFEEQMYFDEETKMTNQTNTTNSSVISQFEVFPISVGYFGNTGEQICNLNGYDDCVAVKLGGGHFYYASSDSSCIGEQIVVPMTTRLFSCSITITEMVTGNCYTNSDTGLHEPIYGDYRLVSGEYSDVICSK